MNTYITQDINGNITASADWAFPGSTRAGQPVLRGHDGKLYFKDELPLKPQPSLSEQKAAKKDALNAAFETASKEAHCNSSVGFVINADEMANRNISSLIIAMEATGRETARFCAFDNTFHPVTLDQLKTMQLEIIAHAQGLYERKWALREKIDAATTVEELETIVPVLSPGEAS